MYYLDLLNDEIELIADNENIGEFVRQALALVPPFQMNHEEVEYVKRVAANVRAMAEVMDAEDNIRDMMTCAALIHAICKYDLVDGEREYDNLHMLQVRGFLTGLQAVAGRENYNNIMLLIESQDGFFSPIPQVMPRINDPAHMWILPFAIKLARSE